METILATLDLATLELYKSEAIVALHKLSTGTKVVSIGNSTDSTTYTEANMADLETYIRQLTSAINIKSGASLTRRPLLIYPS